MKRNKRTKKERRLIDAAEALFPTGTRQVTFNEECDFVVKSAKGSRLTDVSGNEYIDYLLGSGPHILGHAHPAVVKTLKKLAEKGSSYLIVSEEAVKLAQKIVEHVPCAEMVTFHSSGTEATFFALRLARAYTGREKILKFEGGYHGMHDYALMSNQWTMMPPPFPQAAANSHGIPRSVQAEVLIAPYNDLETTASIIDAHKHELAAVIIEPMQRTLTPKPLFLRGLRDITENLDIPLIFDEVVTGFRLGLGGAQEAFGVTPDLAAMGKAISGGLPLGVLCGAERLMEIANPKRRMQMLPFTMQTGTFSSNPLSTGVACAVIAELEKPGFYERLESVGSRLMLGLKEAMDDAGVRAQVVGVPSVFNIFFLDHVPTDHRSSKGADPFKPFRFGDLLLKEGVLKAAEKFFVSGAHSDEDVERTIKAFRAAAQKLAEEERP